MEQLSNKFEMPKFIKVPIVLLLQEANENLGIKRECMKAEARLNPFSISSYYPSRYGDEEDGHSATQVICAGSSYHLDMPIEDFDKMIDEIDRAMSLH